MPVVTFDRLALGEVYDRRELATLWSYAAHNALNRGVVTPAGDNKIVLFVTHEKQRGQTQYEDYFEGDRLHWEGETSHANDNRVVNATSAGDEIHLFYRDRHDIDFTYFGQIALVEHTIYPDRPSQFVFDTRRAEALTTNALATEELTHGQGEAFLGDPEGRRRYALHVSYERSPRNRAEAIHIHGTTCCCCGFDFDRVYGPELARSYIEVHHIESITEAEGAVLNPATDLVPLCSNCHSMVHRRRGEIMPVTELQEIMRQVGFIFRPSFRST
jgi:5-methylcytosine-specific restriction protein A